MMGSAGGDGEGERSRCDLAGVEPLLWAAISAWVGLGPGLGGGWGALSSGSWASPGTEGRLPVGSGQPEV